MGVSDRASFVTAEATAIAVCHMAIGLEAASDADLMVARELAAGLIGESIATLETSRIMRALNPMSTMVFKENGEVTGVLGALPLLPWLLARLTLLPAGARRSGLAGLALLATLREPTPLALLTRLTLLALLTPVLLLAALSLLPAIRRVAVLGRVAGLASAFGERLETAHEVAGAIE